MNKLEELIEKLCPNGVEYKKLGEFCEIKTGAGITKKDTVENGKYKIISGGIEPLGLCNICNRKPNTVTIARAGSAGFVNYITEDFYLNDKCFSIIPDDSINRKFLYYALKKIQENIYSLKSSGTVPTVNTERVANICIPVPPMDVQCEIVHILDNFTLLSAELSTELEARKKQYEYYNYNLLKFENIPYYTLEELCDIVDYRGKTPKKTNEGIFLVTAKNIRKGYIDYEKSQEFISEQDYAEVMRRGMPKVGDVLITTEAPCGNVAQVDDENIALAQRVIKYRPKDNRLDSTFLKYILLGEEFQTKLNGKATGGTVKGIKGSILHKLTIPLPSIEEQRKIVKILDRFNKLCNDISEGLPAEINARQKQYEYYRDKILTFKMIGD